MARGRRRPSGGFADEEEDWGVEGSRRSGLGDAGRQALTVLAILLAAAVVFVGGALLPVQKASRVAGAAPLVGRTTSVCAVGAAPSANPSATPSAASATPTPPATSPTPSASPSTTSVSAVAIRQPSARAGVLTAAPLSGGAPAATIDSPGSGKQMASPASSLLLQGVGGMATASAGATLSSADRGETAGLMAAPCTAPATSHWLVGLGADETHRSDLVLSNPDDAQAEVDLRFYGRTGLLVVPGSSGLVVPAHGSRDISLPSLVGRAGPLGVWVRATAGRVAAIGRDLYSVNLDPAGADWHQDSAPPGTDLVIPGVPDGPGSRDLVVTNPGTDRATVAVSVLGASGSFSPAGAAQVVVEPESTATVSVAAGLAGQAAGVALLSDRPVTAAVISTSQATDPATGSAERPDIAVQPAAPSLGGTGVSAIATAPGADSELVLSNGSDTDAAVSFSVLSLTGVELHRADMLVPAHGTSIRRLTSAPPSYLVLDLPDGPTLYGSVRLASTSGPVGGLASLQITSPDLASRVRSAVPDPTVAR